MAFPEFDSPGVPDVYAPDLRHAYLITATPQALAALGTNQGTAAPIVGSTSLVSGGNGTVGVILPSPLNSGRNFTVVNDSASNLLVYPPTGGTINRVAANGSVTLAAGKLQAFVCVDATPGTVRWFTLG